MLTETAASSKIHTVNCATATQYATHTHRHMSALEAQQTRTHKTAAAPVHSLFAATADPPPDWDASLQVWFATISTHALHNSESF